MSPEKRVDHINTDNLNHSGNLDGAMRERPPKDGVPLEALNTGEIEQLVPEHSGELEFDDDERPGFQEKLAELRASHNTGEYTPVEALPTQESLAQQSHTGRNIGIAATAAVAALTAAVVGGVVANEAGKQSTTQEQPANKDTNAKPDNKNATAPSPLASPTNIQSLETAPVATPSKDTEQPTGITTNEFGITDTEYQQIVQSYTIDANEYKTPAQVVAAFVERRNKYYADGNTRQEEAKHLKAPTPSGKVGWNAWATELYTKAFMQGMFIEKAQEKGDLGEQYAQNDKTVKRMWANSVDANETEYKVTTSFEITDANTNENSITVTGTDIVRDNAAEVPSAASDSHKIGEMSYPNSQIIFVLDAPNHRWRVASQK